MTDQNEDELEGETPEESPEDVARRRFIKAAIYVAPTVVSTIVVRKAAAQLSCMPPTPCTPDGVPCTPDGVPCVPDGVPCVPDTSGCVPDLF